MLVAFGVALQTMPGTATAAAGVAGAADKELVAAARAGDVDRVRRLLAQGADPNAVDRITPLMAAATALRAKPENRMDLMRVLLAAGARVNARAVAGETALIFAARFRDVDAINLLLDNGADPNLVARTGVSRLLEAMRSGAGEKEHLEMMQPLLARGADPNARGEGLGTPLSLAVQLRSVAMVKLLLERGADPNLPDHTDTTPLMLAVSR